MDGLDKEFVQPVSGYWGIQLVPETTVFEPISKTLDTPQMYPSIPQVTDQVSSNSKTNDIVTAIGTVANAVIQATKSNQQVTANTSSLATNTPSPTADNGKKTATILWIVGGVVVVATLLFFALKPHN
ncbi:hypothetical protein ACFOW1_09525 [Parasediminibacterium paludis]|uniref:Uncharacterized protein n=1 Tax=Parasediminibacterium paludis TaxID=908966 RepID=A0ABV8PY22_9BACT